jgi:hypothetical protein
LPAVAQRVVLFHLQDYAVAGLLDHDITLGGDNPATNTTELTSSAQGDSYPLRSTTHTTLRL